MSIDRDLVTPRAAGRAPATRGRARAARIAVAVLAGVLTMAGAMAAALRWPVEPPAPKDVRPRAPAFAFPGGQGSPSTITPESYVGAEACARCHRKNYRSWLDHPHRRMNQLAGEDTVLGDFDARELAIAGGVARFERTPAGAFTLTLERPGLPRRAYRVTRTIGSRLKQFYAGVLIAGEPIGRNGADDEVVLPFGFWIHQRRWMPISYFDPYGIDVDAHGKPSFDPWKPKDIAIAKVCAYCHNTMPYVYRFGTDPDALGFALRDMVIDERALRAELGKLVELPGDASFPPVFAARLPLDSALVSVGISCESCHFGARAHAEDDDDYRFGPSSPHLALRPADARHSAERDKRNPWVVNGICRQCHSSGGDSHPDGSSLINSRESLELESGACASKIACTSCHNPHVAGPAQEGGPDDPSHLAACTGCHAQYEDERAAQAHARHTPAQASCLDCHMPRITPGVTQAVRSHRISAPGDPRMLAAAAPNACNLCHADKSAAWTIAQLNQRRSQPIRPEPAWAAAWGGSLDNAALDVWAQSPVQATQLVLIDLLARRNDRDSLLRLITQLEDGAGMTRAYAALALERRLGRTLAPSELDVTAEPERRAEQIAALRRTLAVAAHSPVPAR